ncbi:MAG: hypothetical protein ABFD57_08895 [Smithella sp.]|nr:hypothetical protein [Syntrophaceae bacterium]
MATINNQLKISKGKGLKKYLKGLFFLPVVLIIVLNMVSCGAEMGQVVISKPDEYRHIYEAKERVILNAIARIFKDKRMGSNVRIDREKNQIDTDYVIEGDWRTKSIAKVNRLNWKESEVTISIITEKKTQTGWETRRLLDKDQYISLFDKIDLAIYEEMSKIE